MKLLNEWSNNSSPFHFPLAVINGTCICYAPITLNMHYYHLCVKGTVLHKTVEGPYTGLKDCGGAGRRYSSVRSSIKGHKQSPTKTAPQLNLSSDVLRAALLFRENIGRLKKLAKTSALHAGLAVKHPRPISVLPLSSLLPSYADTYLYLHLLIPVLWHTDVLCSARIFPEAAAALAGVNTV